LQPDFAPLQGGDKHRYFGHSDLQVLKNPPFERGVTFGPDRNVHVVGPQSGQHIGRVTDRRHERSLKRRAWSQYARPLFPYGYVGDLTGCDRPVELRIRQRLLSGLGDDNSAAQESDNDKEN